jgi:hypothetical protein
LGVELDPRDFTEGLRVGPQPALTFPLRRRGEVIDFNFGDFDVVVVPASLGEKLEAVVGSSLQRFPARVESSELPFEVLNVTDLVSCIDEPRSEILKWSSEDEYPEKAGEYRMITRLRIDPRAAEGHALFRLAGWPIALIASEQIKQLLESEKTTGLRFERVD